MKLKQRNDPSLRFQVRLTEIGLKVMIKNYKYPRYTRFDIDEVDKDTQEVTTTPNENETSDETRPEQSSKRKVVTPISREKRKPKNSVEATDLDHMDQQDNEDEDNNDADSRKTDETEVVSKEDDKKV